MRTRHSTRGSIWGLLLAAATLTVAGCTRESLRIALETQRRADEVEETVVQRQHEALCILLYRDLQRQLDAAGVALDDTQRTALSAAWNDRDLLEFWLVQHERVKALRLVGVDMKLAADQSVLDLLIKQLEVRTGRIEQGLAVDAAGRAIDAAGPPEK
jgi:hypothetical protein